MERPTEKTAPVKPIAPSNELVSPGGVIREKGSLCPRCLRRHRRIERAIRKSCCELAITVGKREEL